MTESIHGSELNGCSKDINMDAIAGVSVLGASTLLTVWEIAF